MLRQTLPLFLVLVPLAAHAQTPVAIQVPPAIQLPISIQSGAQIQLPAPARADKMRLQVLLAGSTTILDDERANIQNGIAAARLEADPGLYDVRFVTDDKIRAPIGGVTRFQISGFKRETGRWLLNGSPIVYEGQNPAPATSFVPNLRRDKKTKLPLSISTNGALKWDVAGLNGVSAPTRLLLGAASAGDFEGAIGGLLSDEQYRDNWKRARTSLDAISPNAAFLLEVTDTDVLNMPVARRLDALAPLADAVVVDYSQIQDEMGGATAIYDVQQSLLKIARRNVEESPNFDLPLFVRFQNAPSPSAVLRAFQGGASNIIVPDGTSNPVLDVLTRQSARFSGAVTLEDAGLRAPDFTRFAPILRRAGRVPLLARLPGEGNSDKKDDDKNAESLIIGFDATTDTAMLDKIERAAKVGATIYCEGALPPALFARWSDITKTQVKSLPAPKQSTLTLAEPWFWGTLNDQNFDVSQTLTIDVKPSLAAQTKDVKGEARETVARPIARFNDDPNAIMLCPVGKGRIIWAPFAVAPNVSFGRQRTKISQGLIYDNDLVPISTERMITPVQQTAYYAAVAGAMQPSLVECSATTGDVSTISFALRALPADPNNPKSSAISLVALFNSANTSLDLTARVRGEGSYALDLMNDQPITVKTRDFGTIMSLQIPAQGFRWIAVAKDAQSWTDAAKGKVKAQLK